MGIGDASWQRLGHQSAQISALDRLINDPPLADGLRQAAGPDAGPAPTTDRLPRPTTLRPGGPGSELARTSIFIAVHTPLLVPSMGPLAPLQQTARAAKSLRSLLTASILIDCSSHPPRGRD